MAKCKDCLHMELCARDERLTEFSPEQEALCQMFIDRSRYVVQEKGEWLHVCGKGRHAEYECSECKIHVCFDEKIGGDIPAYNFCPNCGADMRKGENG